MVWALAVFGTAVFPDARLRKRAAAILEQRMSRPGDGIPQAAGSPAAAKATYRFVENPRVRANLIWDPVHDWTAKRLCGLEWVFALQDTTALMYPTLAATEGLGTMNTQKEEALLMHSVLALRPDGHVVGLLDNEVWARPPEEFGKRAGRKKRPIEDKESFKWVRANRRTAELRDRHSPATRLVYVDDREADIHEVFQSILDQGDGAIIRNRHDRMVEGPHLTVWSTVEARPVLERLRVDVPRRKGEPKRWATLEMRAATVTLRCSTRHPERRPLSLGVVWVHEPAPPPGAEPLDWMLWTTLPIDTVEQCVEVLRGYRLRWRIEDFHRTLKDGLKIERSQLKTAERIETHLAFCSAVAVRLLQLTHWARTEPQSLCTEVLAEDEWQALWLSVHESWRSARQGPPTMREAVRMIGRLGGHLGRKCDGMPGVRSLWKGWRDLQLVVKHHRLLRAHGPPG